MSGPASGHLAGPAGGWGKRFYPSLDTLQAMSELRDAVGPATATLVSAPSSREACPDLLSMAGPETTVVWVTYTRSPSDCAERFREAGGAGTLAVIAVGEAAAPSAPPGVSVETVSTPEDLTGLGILLSRKVSDHEDVVVCFDSLTELLRHVDRETAYEFLNAVTGHLYAADARAHFHLEAGAHDEETVGTLGSLFDAVAERRDGQWTVRTRSLL